jgi:hypothetical protein
MKRISHLIEEKGEGETSQIKFYINMKNKKEPKDILRLNVVLWSFFYHLHSILRARIDEIARILNNLAISMIIDYEM